MDIRSTLAADAYARSRAATNPQPVEGGAADFASSTVRDFAQQLQAVEMASEGALVGDADPHSLVEALAQSQLAVDTAVTVRDRVVEAYQEILRMPV